MEVHINIDYKQLYERERIKREALEAEMLKMKLHVQKLSQMIFGSKSERFIANPAQLALDLPVDMAAPSKKLGSAKKVEYISTPKHSKRSLKELGAYLQDLPRVYEVRKPDNLPDNAVKIGEQQHEVLEITPARAYVKVIVLQTYKIPDIHNGSIIATPPTPKRPLPKCIAGPTILAQILVDKFCDHLPMLRQVKRFERDGVFIPYNTILDWAGKAADLLDVFMEPLKKAILASGYMHVDETGLKVLLGKESSSKNHKHIHGGYLWCYNSSREKLVFFDYRPGRGEEHTHPILKGFKGIIQTDGWQVYKNLASKNQDIIQICCLAHARRKFKDSLPYDKDRATYALDKFKLLYDIERQCKQENLTDDQIKKRRQQEAVPILAALHDWMVEQYKLLLPSSPLSMAINYNLKHWERLCYYTTDGKLGPDNNPVENSIRPAALGRRNYLFAGSHRGAERVAIMYSLVGTCKMNGVNPLEWLTDVLGRINEHPINKIHELLPHNWIKNQAALTA